METAIDLRNDNSIVDGERIGRQSGDVPGSNQDRFAEYIAQLEILAANHLQIRAQLHPFAYLLHAKRHSEWT